MITVREALRSTLREALEEDERVILMGEEIGVFGGSYKVTEGLWDEFGPKRVRETPISEEGFVGAAIGAAMMGLRPVVEIMTCNFALVAFDQIANHAAKIHYMFGGGAGCPLVIRMPGGAGVQLTAQHSQSLETLFAHIPGLKVVAPSDPESAAGLLRAAIADDDPVVFIENLKLYNTKGEPGEGTTEIGRARVARRGSDITVVTHGFTTVRALAVAERMDDVSVEVVDLLSLRPMDIETVAESVRRTNRVVCAEEGWSSFGISAEVAARITSHCFDDLDAPPTRLGMVEVPTPYARALEQAVLPSEDRLEAAIRDTLG